MKLVVKAIIAILAIFSVLFLLVAQFTKNDPGDYQWFEVQKGDFEILVTVTGEVEAERSTRITGPSALLSRNIRLNRIPIIDLIPEGTIVDEGDWVATLDRTEAELSLADLEDRMLREEAQLNSTKLDTAIMLGNLRDEIINLDHTVEEMRLILGQSAYEPPATIRQAEINLQRAERNLMQARDNYVLRERDAIERVREEELDLERRTRRYQELSNVIEQFIITAPAPGMVIYHREWNGSKRTVGSTIHPRDLTVAVLPDLSSLVSRTYVNEIDVDLVAIGQQVRIGLDAFPEREYPGRVVDVSNVGQELPNTDAKVFEVLVLIEQIDGILRPAMTTSNAIITGRFRDVHYVPLAAVHHSDAISYVYKEDGTRQIVITGAGNDNFIIVENGLEEGELVCLEIPENGDSFRFVGYELLSGN